MLARIATFIWLGLAAATAHADDTVRVLLDEDMKPMEFKSLSPIIFSTGAEKLFLNHPRPEVRVERIKDQWVIHVRTKTHKENYRLNGTHLDMTSLSLQWNGNKLEFPIRITYNATNKNQYSLVGVMTMNRYLGGVVEHEMPSSWPSEALKAQVVASRTYAIWKTRTQHNDIYDLRPSVMDQVFRLNRVHESSSLPPSVGFALNATEGLYLTDKSNRVLKAYFHSDCGGATSSAEEVWGQAGSGIAPARDVACEARSSGWSSQWSLDRLRSRLMGEFVLPPDAKLMDVVVREKSDSSRAEWVDLIFSKGIFKRVRGEDIRRLLGYDKIKSTMFAVQKDATGWTFKGRGFGHGVGMCQHGAKAMAKGGADFKKILAHYYPASVLQGAPLLKTAPQSVSLLFEPVE